VIIQSKTLQVVKGHVGKSSFQLTADSQTWLGFLAKEKNLLLALLRRKNRITGFIRFLEAFARCLPA